MASITKRVAKALQEEFVEGTIYRVDLDRVDVAPAGSPGILHSLPLTGDRDKVKPGDPVKVINVGGERVALAGDMALDEEEDQTSELPERWRAELAEMVGARTEEGSSETDINLGDLRNVDTTTTPPTNGDALVWDDAIQQWVPKGGGGVTAHTHPGTDITSAVANATNATNLTGGEGKMASIRSTSGGGMINNTEGRYLHLGGWGVARTAANAVLVNTAYMADQVPWSGVTGKPYVYVPVAPQINAANLYGTQISSFGATAYNVSLLFPGIPASAVGLALRMTCRDAGVTAAGPEIVFACGATGDIATGSWSYVRALLNFRHNDTNLIQPITVYNVIYLRAAASGAATLTVYLTCMGYFI